MKQIKFIVVAFALVALSGCGLYTTYQRDVDEQITDNLYSYIEATNDTSNLSSMPWCELFTDPNLQALIEQALEQNSDLSVARLNVEQAEATLYVARKSFLPSLNAAAQEAVVDLGGASASVFSASLASTWEVDLFGRLRNAKMAAAAALEQSVAYRQGVQTQLIATVAGSYYSLLLLDEQLRISEQTQQSWDESVRAMGAMLRAGRINETALLQAQANSLALSSQIVSYKESIAQLENSLSLLLAVPTSAIKRGTMADAQFPETLGVGVPMELLSSRPDVRMAESVLAEAYYLTAEARSSLYPSIALSVTATYSASEILLGAVGSIVQPIFNHGSLKAQVKISEAQQQQAFIEFKQSILDAGAEVNNALSGWQSARERLEYTQVQIELLEKAAAKTSLLMQHGSATYIEVLTAQISLLSSELSLAVENYNQAQGVINLYRALGGGE